MNTAGLVREIAVFGLPGQDRPLTAKLRHDGPLGPEPWSELMERVEGQRLTGFLAAAVRAGQLPVTEAQLTQVEQVHRRWRVSAAALDEILVDLAVAFDAAGITFLVLKGSATAHLAYPDPALKVSGDNDVLFAPGSYAAALDLLAERGYRRTSPRVGRAFESRYAKGVTLRGPAGDDLDAHRTLVFATVGLRIDVAGLFEDTAEFTLSGRQMRALGPEARLLHACCHAALGDPVPRYGSLRDVAQLLIHGGHDTDRTLELARAWRAEAVLARALILCRDRLGVTVDGPLVDAVSAYSPTARERRAIASYVGPRRGYPAKVWASLPYLDGVGAKLAFVRASLLTPAALGTVVGRRARATTATPRTPATGGDDGGGR